MKRIWLLTACLAVLMLANGQVKTERVPFVERDSVLSMDIYTPTETQDSLRPCVVFVFGGGFIRGAKDEKENVAYCRALAERGYVSVAIDYRLGMKGVTKVGVFNYHPLENAIQMAVEDLYAATNYLLEHSDKLGIDTKRIIISGSSAGAITVLQADYELANQMEAAKVLPTDFHYAGVVSFAGAIFSHEGKPDYKRNPAPTLMFHGTNDELVPYKKIQLGQLGFFGSNEIAKQMEKYEFPFYIYRYRDMGHEIASIPMEKNIEDIDRFIKDYVINQYPLRKDITVKDERIKAGKNWKPEDLYKN